MSSKFLISILFRQALLVIGIACSTALLAGPIGYLKSDQPVAVQPAEALAPTAIDEHDYTVFSGDRIVTETGSAVILLDTGGSIGIARDSGVAVSVDPGSQALTVELLAGTMLYSLPAQSTALTIRLDGHELSSLAGGGQAMRVAFETDHELVGMVERIDQDQFRVSVRNGDLYMNSNHGSRFQIRAGEQLGLTFGGGTVARINTQASGNAAVVLFEAPEQVQAGSEFAVQWNMEGAAGDQFVTIAPQAASPEEFESMASTSQGSSLQFKAPDEPGDYEIRMVDSETGEVSGFVYLSVVGSAAAAAPWYASTAAVVGGVGLAGGAAAVVVLDDDTAVVVDEDDDDIQGLSP